MSGEEKITKCLACAAEFAGVEQQRLHYRSEWHRYNLQRQVAELPCITEREFNEKLQLQTAEADSQKGGAASFRCDVCLKHFFNENVLRDHLTSKKHLVQLAKANKPGNRVGVQRLSSTCSDKETVHTEEKKVSVNCPIQSSQETEAATKSDKNKTKTKESTSSDEEQSDSDAESWETDAIGFEECLFCGTLSQSFEANCTHMERSHLFYIPDVTFCIDLEAMFTFVAERIAIDHECLWCFRTLRSKRAAQQHMLAKQHCRLRYEDEFVLDYADFYDYSRDDESGAQAQPNTDATPEGVRYAMTPVEREELLALLSSDDAFELVLPSGVTIGHRSLVRYYRQRLREHELPIRGANRQHISSGLARSAIAYRPNAQSQRSVLRADELTALERRARDVMHLRRELQNRAAKIGIQANRLQRYFRKQML